MVTATMRHQTALPRLSTQARQQYAARKSTREGSSGTARFLRASCARQGTHAQALPLLGKTTAREPSAMLRDQRERIGKFSARVRNLSPRKQVELGRIGLLGSSRTPGALGLRRERGWWRGYR
jgi:hypothetical protein